MSYEFSLNIETLTRRIVQEVNSREKQEIFAWMEMTAQRYLDYDRDYIVDFRMNESIININNH